MRFTNRLLALTVFAAVAVVPSIAAAESYEKAGPAKTKSAAFTSGAVKGQIAYPTDGAGPFPVIVLGHGFSAAPDNQIGWGLHFASYGFVAIAPELCSGLLCAPDPAAAPQIVSTSIAYLDSAQSPVKGKVDVTKLGLEGHSAGGQALAVVAAQIKPTAVVLFDPVAGMGMSGDSVEPGKTAVAGICSPLMTIFAESQAGANSCNKNGNWKPFGLSSTGPRIGAIVKGSTHCDGENNARALCGFTCGGAADPTRQGRYAHYATAWFLGYLKDDAAALAEATVPKMQADALLHDPAGATGPDCKGNSGGGGSGGSGTGGSGTAGSAGSGTAGSGTAGSGTAGSGTAGSGTAGSGTAGSGTAGSGTAGSGTAGSGTAGSGTAGAGTAGSGTGGASSTGGTSSAGGNAAGGSSGDAGAAGADDAPAADDTSDSGGCGCRTAGQPVSRLGALAGLALAGVALLRRRRRG